MSNARKVDNTKTPTAKNPRKARRPQSKSVRAKTSRLGFRASESQAKIIRMASDISHKSLTEFITDSAYQAAEKIILDQRLFMVSGDIFNQFSETLDRPEQDNEGLKDLFSSSSPWDLNDVKKT
ncbi:DUF1778 domain-containing protein [Legionella waltersii]|uniref:DUF1778 domain-containing protein n=1 Tax=Legionella waltersii TaxID=66969 RepID=A0A0W1A1G6_9GAMM|nr:DUF1778 domain-containing protein [Legionella waltersii]KTD75207.1 hypothetical protein Lwal_3248 [Legionella waltersii]SNU96944.1 Uncharacterized protein conserved in bacteria [Legionella waltersii]